MTRAFVALALSALVLACEAPPGQGGGEETMQTRVRFVANERVDVPDAQALADLPDSEFRRILAVIAEAHTANTGDFDFSSGCTLRSSGFTYDGSDVTLAAGAALLLAPNQGSDAGAGEIATVLADRTFAGAAPDDTHVLYIYARMGAEAPASEADRVFYDGTDPDKEVVTPTMTRKTRAVEWQAVRILTTEEATYTTPFADGWRVVASIRAHVPLPYVRWHTVLPPQYVNAELVSGDTYSSVAACLWRLIRGLNQLRTGSPGGDSDTPPSRSVNALHSALATLEGQNLNTRLTTAEGKVTTLETMRPCLGVQFHHETGEDPPVVVHSTGLSGGAWMEAGQYCFTIAEAFQALNLRHLTLSLSGEWLVDNKPPPVNAAWYMNAYRDANYIFVEFWRWDSGGGDWIKFDLPDYVNVSLVAFTTAS